MTVDLQEAIREAVADHTIRLGVTEATPDVLSWIRFATAEILSLIDEHRPEMTQGWGVVMTVNATKALLKERKAAK